MKVRCSDFATGTVVSPVTGLTQVDMDCLSEPFQKEQKEYYLHTTQWMNVHPQQLLGSPSCFKKYDLHKLTLAELQASACVVHGLPGRGFDACL